MAVIHHPCYTWSSPSTFSSAHVALLHAHSTPCVKQVDGKPLEDERPLAPLAASTPPPIRPQLAAYTPAGSSGAASGSPAGQSASAPLAAPRPRASGVPSRLAASSAAAAAEVATPAPSAAGACAELGSSAGSLVGSSRRATVPPNSIGRCTGGAGGAVGFGSAGRDDGGLASAFGATPPTGPAGGMRGGAASTPGTRGVSLAERCAQVWPSDVRRSILTRAKMLSIWCSMLSRMAVRDHAALGAGCGQCTILRKAFMRSSRNAT